MSFPQERHQFLFHQFLFNWMHVLTRQTVAVTAKFKPFHIWQLSRSTPTARVTHSEIPSFTNQPFVLQQISFCLLKNSLR